MAVGRPTQPTNGLRYREQFGWDSPSMSGDQCLQSSLQPARFYYPTRVLLLADGPMTGWFEPADTKPRLHGGAFLLGSVSGPSTNEGYVKLEDRRARMPGQAKARWTSASPWFPVGVERWTARTPVIVEPRIGVERPFPIHPKENPRRMTGLPC